MFVIRGRGNTRRPTSHSLPNHLIISRHSEEDRSRLQEGNVGLTIRRSSIDGMGCFSHVQLPARKKFGEFVGEKISAREARDRVARGGKISICEIDHRWSVDASRSGSPTAFINQLVCA